MKELGIAFKGKSAVDHCTTKHLCLGSGVVLESDIIVWTAGNRANSFFERYPDVFTLDPKKRVMVSEFQQANNPNIYVLGDAASTKYSGMAQTAINDAVQLADNFKRFVRDQPLKEYEDHPPIVVVPIGPNWALSPKGTHILTGEAGWKVRREADYFVLSNYLAEADAKRHWEKGLQVAKLGDL
jgi:NADH dehydrogenase FAD-containing subunit